MSDKKFLDGVNPERREFLEKVTKGAFIIPTVISIMMLNQKLNLTTANAQSNDEVQAVPVFRDFNLDPGRERLYNRFETGDVGIYPGLERKQGRKADRARIESIGAGDHSVCHLILDDGRELRSFRRPAA